MKQRNALPMLSVALGVVGFVLRFVQNRTGFEPDTGLPIPGNIPGLLLPVLLIAAAIVLGLLARRLPKGQPGLTFSQQFDLDNRPALTAALAGGAIMAVSGVLEVLSGMGGPSSAISADGMEVIAVSSGSSRSTLIIGVLSIAAGVCLLAGIILCRKAADTPPLIFLAVPALLLVRLIFIYRMYSVNPVLADYYLEILGLILLILGTYRLSGFAVQTGSPRLFTFYTGLTSVLALAMLPDGSVSARLLTLGGAMALTGFERMLRADPAGQQD